jgi:uncharacterized membrane protein YraQ (UPF0718 family)
LSVVFISIVLQSLPFVLVGVLASALVQQHLRGEVVARWMPRRSVPAVLVGTLFGLVAPVCDCGAIPLGRRLMAKGVPTYAAVSFLVAAPVVNPITVAATSAAFQGNLGVVALRLGMTASVAMCIGLLTAQLFGTSRVDLPTLADADAKSQQRAAVGVGAQLGALIDHATAEYADVLFFVVLGALFTAATQTLVPRADLAALGGQRAGSVLALMPVASLLSICSEADAFVARAFATTFSPGAVLAFMTIGQIVDLRNGILLWRALGGKLVLLIVLASYPLVFVEGLLVNRILASP